jgi:hypothetical protein
MLLDEGSRIAGQVGARGAGLGARALVEFSFTAMLLDVCLHTTILYVCCEMCVPVDYYTARCVPTYLYTMYTVAVGSSLAELLARQAGGV